MKPGSHNVAAEVVARAFLEMGATNLQAKLGAEIASRGDHCWIDDQRMRTTLVKPNGGNYHRESIGRARRAMARRGWIESKRIHPQQVPDGAKFPSTHGTTSKRILWKQIGIRSPLTRGEQRRRRLIEADRRQPNAASEAARRPRVAIPPALAALVAEVGPAPEPRRRNPVERPADRAREVDAKMAERIAEARRQIERLRGPP